MAKSKIIERISREIGAPELVERLATAVSGSDLQSLLLEVYRRRAAARSPADLLADHERNRFTRPGSVDPLLLVEFDRGAFRALPDGFERIALSPVAPLGTNSVVATIDQNLAVSTVRNSEVLSDSTNAMALECAARRRDRLRESRGSADRVRLAASHRLVRAQKFDGPLSVTHFQMFAMVTAGRDTGNRRFEAENVFEHLGFYVRLLRDGLAIPAERIRVALTPLSESDHDWLDAELIPQLRGNARGERYELDSERTSGRNYYGSVCFKIFATHPAGEEYELADGGDTAWTQKLLSNRKERFLISGIGTERACVLFGDALRARADSEVGT